MRVLMLSKASLVGIYQRKLEYIAAAGVNLTVAVPPTWKDERGEMRLERAFTTGYTLIDITIRWNGNFHLHYYPTFPRLVHTATPDIVHIDEEPYNMATWHALYHARHARTLFFSWQNIHRRYPPPFRWGERWVLNTVDHAIAGTDSAATVWREKGYTGGMDVIPQFGVDEQLFTPASQRPQRPFTVGYVGRLIPEKGVDVLLRAMAALDGEWCLRLVGGGPLRRELENMAADLHIADRVTFIAQVPSAQMPDEYRLLDALALPSLTRANWKEQFGRVLVEAMAGGVPVVGSDSGAIPGVIGEAGIVVPECDVNALSAALRTLRDNPQQHAHLREAGRARALQHFTHRQVATETVRVYEHMMNQPELPPGGRL
ncbi:MAG: glycosyltransferase family 4 protein [Chloroflexota bacterium]